MTITSFFLIFLFWRTNPLINGIWCTHIQYYEDVQYSTVSMTQLGFLGCVCACSVRSAIYSLSCHGPDEIWMYLCGSAGLTLITYRASGRRNADFTLNHSLKDKHHFDTRGARIVMARGSGWKEVFELFLRMSDPTETYWPFINIIVTLVSYDSLKRQPSSTLRAMLYLHIYIFVSTLTESHHKTCQTIIASFIFLTWNLFCSRCRFSTGFASLSRVKWRLKTMPNLKPLLVSFKLLIHGFYLILPNVLFSSICTS